MALAPPSLALGEIVDVVRLDYDLVEIRLELRRKEP